MTLFSLDLGNKQTKLKSEHKTIVLPSYFVEASRFGNRDVLGFIKSDKAVRDYESTNDKGFTYVWGTDIDFSTVDVVQDTLGFGVDRYTSRDFQLLVDFALAELALDYEEARTGVLEVDVVTGVPTSDYNQDVALAKLVEAIKGDHHITVDGQPLNVRVKTVNILPQPLGTVLNEVLDSNGEMLDSDINDAVIGVVDVGGGTVLIDALAQLNMVEDKRNQLERGAYTVYDKVKRGIQKDGHKISEYEVTDLLRANDEVYVWSPDGVQQIDFSHIVLRERTLFTREIATAIKQTYKGIDRMRKILITGGAANLLDKKEFVKEIEKAEFVTDSELANVNGFYKYGMQLEG